MAGYKKHYAPKPYDPKKRGYNPAWGKKPLAREEHKPISDPSVYQVAFFNAVVAGEHSIVLSSVPGSGKTASEIAAAYLLPSGLRTAMFAFNKDTADTLASKAPVGVDCRTNHSTGMRAITKAYGRVQVDKHKDYRIAAAIVGDDKAENAEEAYNISKTMDLAKSVMADTNEEIDSVIDQFEIDIPKHTDRETFIANTQKALKACYEQTNLISFSDMLGFCWKHKLAMPETYQRLFSDEVQDQTPAQTYIQLASLAPGGKYYGAGQKEQWLYGWAGSSEDGIDDLAKKLSAIQMPLSICYRCPKKVVELCATLVPGIEAWDKAEDGILETCNEERMLKEAKPGSVIISRVNAPLVSYCLRFLREGRKAKIAGRDMGKSLLFFIKNSEANDVSGLIEYTETWRQREIERLSAKNRDFTHVSDKADTILAFASDALSLSQVIDNITKMFSDDTDSNYITLTSCHRVKGKQWPVVWALASTFKAGESNAERNLAYVCFSRAEKELYLVE